MTKGLFLTSNETFEEFITRIRRPKFRKYGSPEELEAYVGLLLDRAESISVSDFFTECRDPDDDKFFELAVSGRADYIITGNIKDFPPNPFRGIPILTPAEFFELELFSS